VHSVAPRLVVAALAALAALLSSGPAAAETPGPFDGTWVYAGGAAQRAALAAAIESVVAEMNPLYRAIARSRLTASAKVPQRYAFSTLADGRLSVVVDASPARATRLDGTPISFRNDEGQTITLRRRLAGGVLTTTGDRGDASQRNVYRLQRDGAILAVTTTIRSAQLPRPLVYHLAYRRE
jgi:hypothetical protein